MQMPTEVLKWKTLTGWVLCDRIKYPKRRMIPHPCCDLCDADMWLTCIEPDKPGHDRRTFPRCLELLAQSGHRLSRRTCLLLSQSGHAPIYPSQVPPWRRAETSSAAGVGRP